MGIDPRTLAHVKDRIQENAYDFRAVEAKKPKPIGRREVENLKLEGGEKRGGFRIKFVQLRHRLLDSHDNLPMSCKPLADRITERLGLSNDSDGTIEWTYEQIKTKGVEGVLIIIESI